MSLSNRAEQIPLWLVSIDGCLATVVALLVVAGRGATIPLFLIIPGTYVVAMYISGEYSVLSEVGRDKRRSLILVFAVTTVAAAAVIPGEWFPHVGSFKPAGRVVVAIVSAVGLLLLHRQIKRVLLDRSQFIFLTFPPEFAEASRAVERHLKRSGYPGKIITTALSNADPSRLPARIFGPHREASEDFALSTESVEVTFDPARFCDVVLRVLPPKVLELRPDYVDWAKVERRLYDVPKRMFDVIVSALLVITFAPVWAAIALGIWISSPGPVFFRQTRIGMKGRPFELIKFRSLAASTEGGGTPNDAIESRAFAFGRFLRRSHLDELPQALNILRGDMSVIGPRPEMEFFHLRSISTIPHYDRRLMVRPGLSGWAQVRFSHTTSVSEYLDKTAYDLWYVRHRTMYLDLKICIRTIGIALLGIGSR